jgi:gamma-D-glutamyl-L-lysine dipeptidyl-peptidase
MRVESYFTNIFVKIWCLTINSNFVSYQAILFIMNPSICCVPVSPIRANASHRSEMVSQLLFGETVAVLESEKDQWIKIRCLYDGYEGWCQQSHVIGLDNDLYAAGSSQMSVNWSTKIDFNGQSMRLPMGCPLPGLKKGQVCWGPYTIRYTGKTWNPSTARMNQENFRKLGFKFLNSPYLWGGKTVFGTDCSGYTQTIFRFFNIPLLRDAWQQAEGGEEVSSLQKSGFGDLAFFDNADGKMTHVGILLNKKEIIHASGKVRIDKIDNEGIMGSRGERTHFLKLIKRYLD